MEHLFGAISAGRKRALPQSFSGSLLLTIAIGAALIARPVALQAPNLRAAFETAISLCALSSAWLLRRRCAATRRPEDLILMCALLTLALVEILTLALPSALNLASDSQFAAAALVGSLFYAVAFLVAAVATEGRPIGRSNQQTGRVALGVTGLSTLCAVVVGFVLQARLVSGGPELGRGFDAAVDLPLAALIALVAAVMLSWAAVRLGQADRFPAAYRNLSEPLVLLAAAQIMFFAVPRVPPHWFSSAEVLRLGAVVLILRWCLLQEREARTALVRAAALAERTRVARDLHDGIAQDLAFIAAYGARMSGKPGEGDALIEAARRALAHSRGAISDLRARADGSTTEALELIARELGARFEVAVTVDVDLDGEIDQPLREDTGRMVREAVANAAQHGGAHIVEISVKRTDDHLTVRVADDGRGIGDAPDGFGLRSIRERAAAHGGSVELRERSSGGTELGVVLP